MSSANDNHSIETLAVHAGVEPDPTTGAVMTPIYQTSTFAQTGINEHKGYDYGRSANPTRDALQTSLAALENGKYGLVYASGLAAMDNILRLIKPGDHVLSGNDVYGGTFRLFENVLADYGIEFAYTDTTDPAAVAAAMKPNTKLIWLESPTNPTLKLTDIEAVAKVVHAGGAWLGVDSTFASPIIQQPLTMGADFVLHSTTKYINGHSDVIGGAIILNDDAIHDRLKYLQNAIGAIPSPMDCFLILRGIKTLAIRVKQHSINALKVAQMLSDHPAVSEVIYPGLESHPQYELAQRQMKYPGGMVSFLLHGGEEAALKVAVETKLFTLAESLGGVESLIELPAPMTHATVADSPLAVDPGLVRLSVGIESADDLINDLKSVLAKL